MDGVVCGVGEVQQRPPVNANAASELPRESGEKAEVVYKRTWDTSTLSGGTQLWGGALKSKGSKMSCC